mmetsp:Transcript_11059/g.41305  ORF Transcript_11059/g.41305 Transcript_11059/m.41305 type:complete len:238 (-) Transcript_11059:1948-2661(-)
MAASSCFLTFSRLRRIEPWIKTTRPSSTKKKATINRHCTNTATNSFSRFRPKSARTKKANPTGNPSSMRKSPNGSGKITRNANKHKNTRVMYLTTQLLCRSSRPISRAALASTVSARLRERISSANFSCFSSNAARRAAISCESFADRSSFPLVSVTVQMDTESESFPMVDVSSGLPLPSRRMESMSDSSSFLASATESSASAAASASASVSSSLATSAAGSDSSASWARDSGVAVL